MRRFVTRSVVPPLAFILVLAIVVDAQSPPQVIPKQSVPRVPAQQELLLPSEEEIIEVTPAPSAMANPEATKRKIQAALDGETPIGSDDPLLDDVLRVLRQRGSVLRGSSLDSDPVANPSLDDDPMDETSAGDVRSQRDPLEVRARAAESLLRAARLLSAVEPQDDIRRELVANMRREAVELLKP